VRGQLGATNERARRSKRDRLGRPRGSRHRQIGPTYFRPRSICSFDVKPVVGIRPRTRNSYETPKEPFPPPRSSSASRPTSPEIVSPAGARARDFEIIPCQRLDNCIEGGGGGGRGIANGDIRVAAWKKKKMRKMKVSAFEDYRDRVDEPAKCNARREEF